MTREERPKVVVAESDLDIIIKHFFDLYKGENSLKLCDRIGEHYAGTLVIS